MLISAQIIGKHRYTTISGNMKSIPKVKASNTLLGICRCIDRRFVVPINKNRSFYEKIFQGVFRT